MRVLPSVLPLFRKMFNHFNPTHRSMNVRFYLSYDSKLTLKSHVWRRKLKKFFLVYLRFCCCKLYSGSSVVVDSLEFYFCCSHCGFVFDSYFAMQYLVYCLALQSNRWGRECWFIYFNCLLDVIRLLVFCASSSR